MKPPPGKTKLRVAVSPKPAQVQLNLRRRLQPPPPEEPVVTEVKSGFWKWVGLVALFHAVLIALVALVYAVTPPPPPKEKFMDLLPPGDVTKGLTAVQQAPKLGPTSQAPSVKHHHQSESVPKPVVHETPPTPKPEAVEPPPPPVPTPEPPPPVVKEVAPPPIPKPVAKADIAPLVPEPAPVKPPKPKPPKPKIKVDLTLADGPAEVNDKPAKPKPAHTKPSETKPAAATNDSSAPDHDAPDAPDSPGLSKEEIAAQLGKKLEAAGTREATQAARSGSVHGKENPFGDFYNSVRDQVMDKWQHPNLTDDTAVNPVVLIHAEKDGRVPPEGVSISRSSGNQTYDDSAVAAAKSLGHLLQPLPEGCPPDIYITFKLTR